MKFTAQTIRTVSAPEGKADHVYWDDNLPGFGLRLRGQSRTWIVQYRIGQQQRRESLGDVRKVTLEAARDIARTRFAQIQLGTDPGAEKAKAREAASITALTLSNVARRYLDAKQATLRPATFKGCERHFNVHFAPFAARPISEIKRADVAARLQELIAENGRTAAARARSTLSSLYSWAMREGLCDQNPVAQTNDPGQGEARDRVLSDGELVAVWNACAEDDFGRIVKLLILLGCRRDEIGSLRWTEINGNVMTIAAARSKNRKAHTLTLPQAAMDILRSIPRRDGRDYVFAKSGGGFSQWGRYTDAMRERLGDSVKPWRLHDLRRSVATGMAEIGVEPHHVEAVLNHRGHRSGVSGVYNHARYVRGIASALQVWSEHLTAAIENRESKIVPMKRA